MAITKRLAKGSALTHTELDGNFTDLDGRVTTLESASDSDSQTLTLAGDNLTISGGNTVDLSTINSTGILNVVEDTTPQLGGNLDLNSNEITGSGGASISETLSVLTLQGGSNGIVMRSTGTGQLVLGSLGGNVVIGNSSNTVEFVNGVDVDLTNTDVNFTGATVTGLTVSQSIDSLTDVDTSTTPPGVGQVLKWDGSASKWLPANDSSGSGGITLSALSVTQASAGTAGLVYNNVSGVFTYTPPDLSTYLTSVPAQTFASLTGKPTTIAGYGITDAATSAQGTKADNALQPTDISVSTLANAGSGTLTYVGDQAPNTGVLTYTPPDLSGLVSSNTTQVAIGNGATAGVEAVSIGKNAGDSGDYSQAIGNNAGNTGQGVAAVALGSQSGETSQGDKAVAVGQYAGQTTQGVASIAIGQNAGLTTQGDAAIAIGQDAGSQAQGYRGIAIGEGAGETNQASYAIAIGYQSGETAQESWATAVGFAAGTNTQGDRATAIGSNSGQVGQGAGAVAIGVYAGNNGQGADAVAIGKNAGHTNQAANSIAINATGTTLQNSTASSLVIKPIRNAVGTTMLMYDATSGEVTHSGNVTLGGDLDVGGNSIVSASNGAINIAPDGTGTIDLSGQVKFAEGMIEKFATTNGATGVTALDCSTGNVHYLTAPAGDITANFTNLNLTAEYATNVTVVIDQGGTEREITAVQIGGVAQTIVWQGNSAPTGTANGVDSFSFTILNDGGTYVVLGQMVAFGGV